jgi:tetratricopeptide (TPR) repeat protein/opacity protein-like surface antigen
VLSIPRLLPAADAPCEPELARAVSVQGTLEVRRARQSRWEAVRQDERFCLGDAVRTGENSRAAILLHPETVIRLDQHSSLVFSPATSGPAASWLELLKGAAHFISRDPRSLQIVTPFANAAIEGTEFLVRVIPGETRVIVYEGRVRVSNAAGSVGVGSGAAALAQAGSAPVTEAVVRPRDAVAWTLYYPPVLFRGTPRAEEAARLLAVGRVDEANALLDKLLTQDPENSDALALRAIMAVTRNDVAAARELADKAVKAAPDSATALIARSYVQQAQFDLPGALASLESATELAPDNALAWARLAELRLSTGELDQGLQAADRANTLDPNLALTWTIRGFAFLTEIKLPSAMEAFEQAIARDPAAFLPRLGLGLAKIRKGELEAGREEIEIAVALDPGNSLTRSYMGKAFFDEKRDKLAAKQYAMARELDPHDPTPWFYDAILKQTENRPVEALHDLQTSIKLNDDRAVYRSRLQLDEDLASRTASLGQIYRDLGFEQRALVEGWRSVNTDPANYSAHRLLADNYAALPRHQVARVSELLQSQLLQPINLTPVQPQLAEANLFFLEGAGPADPALLEFNPLFTRNRLALQANGVAGNEDTWGDELIQNGVYNNWSWSVGQLHYESDGYRENNDQDQNIYNLFVQGALSWRTSVQAEYRHRKIKSGDLVQRFEPDNFLENDRNKEKNETVRLGIHHLFTPRSEMIASFIYLNDLDIDIDSKVPQDFAPLGTLNTAINHENNGDGYTTELQHLYHGERFGLISGAGYHHSDLKDKTVANSSLTPPSPLIPATRFTSRNDQDLDHKNAYVYANIPPTKDLLITLGASYDDLRRDDNVTSTFSVAGLPAPPPTSGKDRIDVKKLNPKAGITWRVRPDTTLRAAGFRTISRSLVSKQTVEPTQVAGFNQFYDETAGTKAINYGLGADQVFTSDLSGGVEYSWRDIEVPNTDPAIDEVDWDERFGRAYLYWTPTARIATSAEYQYERFKRKDSFTGEFQATKIQTHKVPLEINYFHPNGFIGRLRTTYIDQEGDFSTAGPAFLADIPTEDKSDSFWLVDASLGYRLPKRYGIVSLGVSNLFDKEFNYVDTDPFNPRIYPERFYFGRLTLSF